MDSGAGDDPKSSKTYKRQRRRLRNGRLSFAGVGAPCDPMHSGLLRDNPFPNFFMLTKNVYILYPAGYGGSYVNWSIAISDQDNKHVTRNPLNTTTSATLGGAGTSHNHHRLPTHQGIREHIFWILHNQPRDKKIYIINTDDTTLVDSLVSISRYDPDPQFIIIHDNADNQIRNYGIINCMLKWPAMLWVTMQRLKYHQQTSFGFDAFIPEWNPFDCAQNMQARNDIASGKIKALTGLGPCHTSILELVNLNLGSDRVWFDSRNQYHAHEVNEDYYCVPKKFNTSRLWQITTDFIPSLNFPSWIKNFLKESQCLDTYDTTYLENYHDTYRAAQHNLKWFTSYANWSNNGIIDDYLCSHSVIQGLVIREMFAKLHQLHWDPAINHNQLLANWQQLDLPAINDVFIDLLNTLDKEKHL